MFVLRLVAGYLTLGTMRALMLVVLVLGCAGQEMSGPAQLASSWETEPIAGCSTTLDITPATFELATRCGDSVQAVAGAYVLDGDVLTMNADHATCGAAPRVYADTVSLEPTALLLTNDGGTLRFQHAAPRPGSYGCFINGTFTPSPLAPL